MENITTPVRVGIIRPYEPFVTRCAYPGTSTLNIYAQPGYCRYKGMIVREL